MNSILRRRRALMGHHVPTESWDFQWDYTQGKLESQTEWESVVSGTASSALTASGETFSTGATGSDYYIVRPQSSSPLRTMTGGIGVMEAVINGDISATSYNENFEIRAVESSSKRIGTLIYYMDVLTPPKIAIQDSQFTTIAPFPNNTDCTIRIEMKGTGADVYVDGVKKLSNFSLTASLYGTYNGILALGLGSNSIMLKSLKMKVGRL